MDIDARVVFQSKKERDAYYEAVHALRDPGQTALCLSGGGIRSAAFAFGVIQALARTGTLERFHYLSTVSGGGYIGSWLTAGLHRRGKDQMLKDAGPWQTKLGREPNPIRWLRRYHSFLSPKMGITSADTWTALALVGRNLFLNWLVILPLIVSLLLVFHVYLAAMNGAGADSCFTDRSHVGDIYFVPPPPEKTRIPIERNLPIALPIETALHQHWDCSEIVSA